jgi:Zn-dependent M28 family amino/carboxypeptidase
MKSIFVLCLLVCLTITPEANISKIAVSRSTGSSGNMSTAEYIKTYIGGEYQPFTYRNTRTQNIYSKLIGHVPGEIVICAHYDSVANSPGADDNASGVAVVLELQQRIKTSRHTLVFLLVSGEEQGLLGSQYYVQQSKTKPIFALNLDMVGHLNSVKARAKIPAIETEITKTMAKYTWAPAITLRTGSDSDQTSFANIGVPVIFLHTGLHRYYHRASDTPETLDYEGLAQITKYALDLVRAIDSYDTPDYNLLKGLGEYKNEQ